MNECEGRVDGFDTKELSFECSDEAIEAAAGTGERVAGAVTLSFCSGLDTCPA